MDIPKPKPPSGKAEAYIKNPILSDSRQMMYPFTMILPMRHLMVRLAKER